MTRSDTGTGKRRTLIIIGLIIFIIAAAGFVWVLFQFDRIAKVRPDSKGE